MKNLSKILIAFILIASPINAQDKVTIGITQDVRLAFSEDNAGNKPFTKDIILFADLEGPQFGSFYPSVKLQYETADLAGGEFLKYTVSGGLTYTDLYMPKIWFIPAYDIDFGLFLGGGLLSRPTINNMKNFDAVPAHLVYSVIFEASVKLTRTISFLVKYELNNATDLKFLYGTNEVRNNVSAGFKITVLTKFKN